MKDSDIIVKLNQAISSAKSSLDAVEKWTQLLAEKNGVDPELVKEKAKKLTDLEPLDFDGEEKI